MKRKKDTTPLLTGFEKIDPVKKPLPKSDNPLLSKHTRRLSQVGDENLYPTSPSPDNDYDPDPDNPFPLEEDCFGISPMNFGDN